MNYRLKEMNLSHNKELTIKAFQSVTEDKQKEMKHLENVEALLLQRMSDTINRHQKVSKLFIEAT